MEEDLRVLAEHVVTDIISAVQHNWSPERYDHHATGLENLLRQAHDKGVKKERERCAAICANQYQQGGNSNGPVWQCHDLIIAESEIKKPIGNCKPLLRRPFREDPSGVVYQEKAAVKRQEIIEFVRAAVNVATALANVDFIHGASMEGARIRKQHRKEVLKQFHYANGSMGDIEKALSDVKG